MPRPHVITLDTLKDNPTLRRFCSFNSMSYGLHEHPEATRCLADDLIQARVTIGSLALTEDEIAAIQQHPIRGIKALLNTRRVPPFFIRWYIHSMIYQHSSDDINLQYLDYQLDLHPEEAGVPDLMVTLSNINQTNASIQLHLLFDGGHYQYGHATCSDTTLFRTLSKQQVTTSPEKTAPTTAPTLNSDDSTCLMQFNEKHHDRIPYLTQPTLLKKDRFVCIEADFDCQLQQFNLLAAKAEQTWQQLDLAMTQRESSAIEQQVHYISQLAQYRLDHDIIDNYRLIKRHYKRMTQSHDYWEVVNHYRQAATYQQRLMRKEPDNRIVQAVATREHQLQCSNAHMKIHLQLAMALIKLIEQPANIPHIQEITQLGQQAFKPRRKQTITATPLILLSCCCLAILGTSYCTSFALPLYWLGKLPVVKITVVGVLSGCLGGHLWYSNTIGKQAIRRLCRRLKRTTTK